MEYLHTSQKRLSELTDSVINEHYNQGFVFTRIDKGVMNQIRSLRVDLAKYEPNSENRRILRKNENMLIDYSPLPYTNYDWSIHKMGKDFYNEITGKNSFSASKIKEMFTDMGKSNMNSVFVYEVESKVIGYCLAVITDDIVHYAFPFYDTNLIHSTTGIAMMTKAIAWSKENGKKYVYLGSVYTQKSKYKLQFNGLEWWDEKQNKWSMDINEVKAILSN